MAKFTSTNLVSVNNVSDGIALSDDTQSFYFGEPTISGVWRIRSSNNNLVFEKYDGASWNEKFTMNENGEPLLSLF